MKGKLSKTFVGFGFGPIQSALFLYEAYRSNNFSRFVVAEIDRELVKAVRKNKDRCTVNIAREDCIDQFTVEGIEIYNPLKAEEYHKIAEAVGESDEMCTALPNVDVYTAGNKTGVVNMIGQGLSRRDREMPTIIYTAENNNRAAEILYEQLFQQTAPQKLENLQILNTVIGKMCGVIVDTETINRMSLKTITPEMPRAILVEEFNKILISKIKPADYRRGIDVFIEKKDLLPFEEAKLFGHNAIHALIAYLADIKGFHTIAEAGKDAQIMDIARRAFIEESGAALIKRHEKLNDTLFTENGYKEYADDLLKRMINPNLNDLVERVGRDHPRKLGIEDRLYGTMILALDYGVEPEYLALGAAAGILSMMLSRKSAEGLGLPLFDTPDDLTEKKINKLLRVLWGENKKVDTYGEKLVSLTWKGLERLKRNNQNLLDTGIA